MADADGSKPAQIVVDLTDAVSLQRAHRYVRDALISLDTSGDRMLTYAGQVFDLSDTAQLETVIDLLADEHPITRAQRESAELVDLVEMQEAQRLLDLAESYSSIDLSTPVKARPSATALLARWRELYGG